MMSSNIIKRRFLGKDNILKSEDDVIVTSTPIKKKAAKLLEMEWLSPVDRDSNKPPNPDHPIKPKANRTTQPETIRENKSSKECTDTATESVDKICLVNHFSGPNNDQEVLTQKDIIMKHKSKEINQLVMMSSDEEEEVLKNRSNSAKQKRSMTKNPDRSSTETRRSSRKTKTQEQIETINTVPTIAETAVASDSENHGIIFPKATVESNKAISKEKLLKNKSNSLKQKRNMTKNPNHSLTETQRSSRRKKTQKQIETVNTVPTIADTVVASYSENHGIILPKATIESSKAISSPRKPLNRKRPPLPLTIEKNEAKNSESTMKLSKNLFIDESSTDSDESLVLKLFRKPVEKVTEDDVHAVRRSTRKRWKPLEFWNGEKIDIEPDLTSGIKRKTKSSKKKVNSAQNMAIEPEQIDQISTNTPKLISTDTPEISHIERSRTITKKGSILKSKTTLRSRTNVRFSTMGTGTTIDGPTNKNHIKPDWVINFPEIRAHAELLPESEDCVVLPGLNNTMKSISSAVIKMRPKFISESRAPDLHHLIFCVMVGTVTVTIDETTVRMKTYGHFTVPCGVSYRIKNIGRQRAILSFFKVSANS